ncbi:hypothetical protein ROHU_011420 [Labeo rohita]|uniref:Uncharacterized protein n=1 Tax=Labeo rohita TaxID=84645 RepID=A0A498LLJ3_LABRO|nr:hypothetical protein ROHU_011420 [Labeo rohita]
MRDQPRRRTAGTGGFFRAFSPVIRSSVPKPCFPTNVTLLLKFIPKKRRLISTPICDLSTSANTSKQSLTGRERRFAEYKGVFRPGRVTQQPGEGPGRGSCATGEASLQSAPLPSRPIKPVVHVATCRQGGAREDLLSL